MTNTNDSPLVSLRIMHPSADLLSVTRDLGFIAHTSWKAGEPRSTPKGRSLSGHRESSYVAIKVEQGDSSFDDVLMHLCDGLSADREILKNITETGGSIAIYVTLSCGSGLSVSPTVLSELGELGITLEIDSYH